MIKTILIPACFILSGCFSSNHLEVLNIPSNSFVEDHIAIDLLLVSDKTPNKFVIQLPQGLVLEYSLTLENWDGQKLFFGLPLHFNSLPVGPVTLFISAENEQGVLAQTELKIDLKKKVTQNNLHPKEVRALESYLVNEVPDFVIALNVCDTL